MKLNQLRNAVAIAERGGLRAASRHLGVGQPALSRSVQELEHELGASLFERRALGMRPTPQGKAFIARAKAILSEMRRARDEVEQLHGGTGGRVAAALSSVPHISILPSVLTPFRNRYPDVELHLIEGQYPSVEAGLKDGSIDFYVGPPPERAVPPELTKRKLFDNSRTILMRQGHPLANAKSLRDLTGAEWATTSITHKAEEELGEMFKRHRLAPPRLALRTQSALTLIVSLAYSDLLAMVPVQWTSFAVTAGVLTSVNVKEPLPAPPVVQIRRSGLPLTPAAEFLAGLIDRQVAGRASKANASKTVA